MWGPTTQATQLNGQNTRSRETGCKNATLVSPAVLVLVRAARSGRAGTLLLLALSFDVALLAAPATQTTQKSRKITFTRNAEGQLTGSTCCCSWCGGECSHATQRTQKARR